MSLEPLTHSELQNRYEVELKSRVTIEEAKFYVDDREKKRTVVGSNALCNQNENFTAQTFLPESQNPLNLLDEISHLSSNVKDNMIDQEDIFKYFSMMPPSLDDKRLPENYSKFIISALAAVLQGHYWQHCPSCFKFSKRTNSSKTCRYCYPKDRIEETTQEKKGIVIKRLLGHEYINSYNDVILQTFRCNHDIQILIGGVEMSEVIFYCTKYTTKPQQEAYCSVALALAAYRRRLERERAIAECRELSSEEKSRKRVTGLMYTMTSSIEVAGPLAALYILRKSPSYRSHDFQSIPLNCILKWIIPECDLQKQSNPEAAVNFVKSFSFQKPDVDRNNSGDSSDSSDSDDNNNEVDTDLFLDKTQTRHNIYRVVRPIDDYMYRSDKFNDYSLYEFNCKVYRQKRKENECITNQGFTKDHPLHETHVLRIRKHEAIPVIYGDKLKFLNDDSNSFDKKMK